MDYFEQLKQYIEDNFTLFKPTLSVGLLLNSNDICIRPTPSAPSEKYLDYSRCYYFGFQVLVRHINQMTAYQTCMSLANGLDVLQNCAIESGDNSFEFIKNELSTTVNFVERDQEGSIYTFLCTSELYLEGVS